MILFQIVREPYGWAVRRDDQMMMMPAACRTVAIAEAERMVAALRRLGKPVRLMLEAEEAFEKAA